MSFLNSGEQTCPDFLKYILKMVLELLAHIGMRKNERHPQPWIFFSQEASFPALDGGVDRLSTDAFLPWPDFSSVQLLSCV